MAWPIDDVRNACRVIGAKERQAGEKAFPEVGTIVAECERQSKHRLRSSHDRCGFCSDGMVFARDGSGMRPCPSCGGPKWFEDSIHHNNSLPIPRRHS